MDAKRWLCLILLTSLLAACGQSAAIPTPTPAAAATPSTLQFRSPYGIFVDPGGRIYVADRGNHRIVRMDDMRGGGWIAYGSWGTEPGQFKNPSDVSVDSGGRIYVADTGNNRIARMDDMTGSNWITLGSQWTTGGGSGSGVGQFNYPTSVLVDAGGRICVADAKNNRIVCMDDMSGGNWTTYGSQGLEAGQFYFASSVWVDSASRIYAVGVANCRISRMDDMTGSNWTAYGSSGGGIHEFGYPWDVCVDSAGSIYISDGSQRIVRVDDLSGNGWIAYGVNGKGVGEFMTGPDVESLEFASGPAGLFVDAQSRIYVADAFNSRIVRMDDMNGTNWTTFP